MAKIPAKLAMLRAAERLFAERGVDVVSLREIAAAAGQKNHSAALYHFGDKRELLEALLERHSGPFDKAYAPALEELAASGKESLTTLITLLVDPLVEKLSDEDGGPQYLLICAELVHSKTHPLTGLRAANGPGSTELRMRLFPHFPEIDAALLPLRAMQIASMLFGSIAAYHRLSVACLFIPKETFRDDLVRTLVSLLQQQAAKEM